ncbi:LLM class flavin-dependent oxidoreductase [Rhodococcus sp. NPDC057014]|uniref:LLM class flavin-dependent oxidoreductase n=1 Tax=Rhodococcus sp. NPDC057014 TaxID=3346000 RepID=UPI003640F6E9
MRLSILDYSPVDEGETARDALNATTRLAQQADALGFERFWVSEHHHTDSLASTAPEGLMMHLAASTDRIRVGSGGVMLPHYSSIKVAENYKLIEALYPNRVDLGFGRTPGADHLITHALNEEKGVELAYADKVRDLKAFVSGAYPDGHRFSGVVARPRLETTPQMWVLGASGNTSELAASEGLGFVFAHFINPSGRGPHAADAYRRRFTPSAFLDQPEVIVAVFVADTEDEARESAATVHLWLAQVEGRRAPVHRFPSVRTARQHQYSPAEKAAITRNQPRVLAGTAPRVYAGLTALAQRYRTDQIMILPVVAAAEARLRAVEFLAAEAGRAHPLSA